MTTQDNAAPKPDKTTDNTFAGPPTMDYDLLNKVSNMGRLTHSMTLMRKMEGELSTRIMRAKQSPKGTYTPERIAAAEQRLAAIRGSYQELQQVINQAQNDIDSYTEV